jgi:hypothetical protein
MGNVFEYVRIRGQNSKLVVIILNSIQFEAERFETRTMPTPNMKGKEVIYWIKVNTTDKRLATEIQKFLDGAPRFIELKVPSAFISTRTELENVIPLREAIAQTENTESGSEQSSKESYRLEIVLRRTLPETPERKPQSPYG